MFRAQKSHASSAIKYRQTPTATRSRSPILGRYTTRQMLALDFARSWPREEEV